jgi:hypothetical protein
VPAWETALLNDVLEVRPGGERWVVATAQGTVLSSYRTQQQAIEAGKALASRMHGEVRWADRTGSLQGSASYRLFTWMPKRPWWARIWTTPKGRQRIDDGPMAAKAELGGSSQ